MAEQKETFVLDFKVDTSDAVVSIESLTKANKELRDERKKVDLSTDEGIKKVQAINQQIDKNTATIKANSSAIEKQRLNVGNYTESIKKAGAEMNIAGQNLGQLTTKMSSFLNPATAAVGIVSALGAAYASSTTGAKDLEFASNQLSTATSLLTEKFASLFSSAEDGEGFFSKITNSIISQFGSEGQALAAVSHAIALMREELQDLQRDEISIRGDISDRLGDNAEKLTKIGQEQTSNNEKLKLYSEIIENLKKNQEDIVGVKQKELDILKSISNADPNNEDKLTAALNAEKDLNRERTKAEKLIQANQRAQDNLRDSIFSGNKAVEAGIAGKEEEIGLTEYELQLRKEVTDQIEEEGAAALETANSYDEWEHSTENVAKSTKKTTAELSLQLQQLEAISNVLGNSAALFEKDTAAYKIIASARAVIDTYRGVTASLAEGGFLGIATAAVTLATGLAAVAKINEVGFSEGGYTGPGGKYQYAGVVHKGEVVWNQKDVAAVGGPSAANSLRPSYYDGGIVAAGSAKSLPGMGSQKAQVVYLTLKEFREFETSVQYKENLTTA